MGAAVKLAPPQQPYELDITLLQGAVLSIGYSFFGRMMGLSDSIDVKGKVREGTAVYIGFVAGKSLAHLASMYI